MYSKETLIPRERDKHIRVLAKEHKSLSHIDVKPMNIKIQKSTSK
jgi:hypothetical protein